MLPQTSEQVLQRLENYSEKYKEMSSSHGGDARATSAPAQRRWRSGKETRTPDDAGSMMTARSMEMDLERVENAQRKKFVPTPGSVPADIALMEEEELSLEKARVKDQVEAATAAIIMFKKDKQELEKMMRESEAKREAAIRNFNEEHQAYLMDLSSCLDKLQSLNSERSTIEERLEYVKYEMQRRVLQEQAMETSSVCSAAGTETRIADRVATDDRPQRKHPSGDVPRPEAAVLSLISPKAPGEVVAKPRPPAPPIAAPAKAPTLGEAPAKVEAAALGGESGAADAGATGGSHLQPPPPPQAAPRKVETADVGLSPWDMSAPAGSGGPVYVAGEFQSQRAQTGQKPQSPQLHNEGHWTGQQIEES